MKRTLVSYALSGFGGRSSTSKPAASSAAQTLDANAASAPRLLSTTIAVGRA
jgi:hypothetical protein